MLGWSILGKAGEQFHLGRLGQSLIHRPTLYLLQESTKVLLKLLSLLHASMREQVLTHKPLSLPGHLIPQVLLRQLNLVNGVNTRDLSEAIEGKAGGGVGVVEPGG